MTTVVVDRKLRAMAGDKQMTCDNQRAKHVKVSKVEDVIIGYCGVSEAGVAFKLWYETYLKNDVAIASGLPANPDRDKHYPATDDFSALVLHKSGKLYWYGKLGYGVEVHDRYFGIGSGSDYGLGALYAGASLEQAVKIASKLDNKTGMGVTLLLFDGGEKRGKRTRKST